MTNISAHWDGLRGHRYVRGTRKYLILPTVIPGLLIGALLAVAVYRWW